MKKTVKAKKKKKKPFIFNFVEVSVKDKENAKSLIEKEYNKIKKVLCSFADSEKKIDLPSFEFFYQGDAKSQKAVKGVIIIQELFESKDFKDTTNAVLYVMKSFRIFMKKLQSRLKKRNWSIKARHMCYCINSIPVGKYSKVKVKKKTGEGKLIRAIIHHLNNIGKRCGIRLIRANLLLPRYVKKCSESPKVVKRFSEASFPQKTGPIQKLITNEKRLNLFFPTLIQNCKIEWIESYKSFNARDSFGRRGEFIDEKDESDDEENEEEKKEVSADLSKVLKMTSSNLRKKRENHSPSQKKITNTKKELKKNETGTKRIRRENQDPVQFSGNSGNIMSLIGPKPKKPKLEEVKKTLSYDECLSHLRVHINNMNEKERLECQKTINSFF